MIELQSHVSMYLAKHVAGWTLVAIGRFYNRRHHTTVLHAASKIEQLRSHDESLDALLDVLTEAIGLQPVAAPSGSEPRSASAGEVFRLLPRALETDPLCRREQPKPAPNASMSSVVRITAVKSPVRNHACAWLYSSRRDVVRGSGSRLGIGWQSALERYSCGQTPYVTWS
jgi:hypothetical protein